MTSAILTIPGAPMFVRKGPAPKCGPATAHLFFTVDEDEKRPNMDGVKLARRVCAGCPLRAACLEYGMNHLESGVWGGVYLSAGQRGKFGNGSLR